MLDDDGVPNAPLHVLMLSTKDFLLISLSILWKDIANCKLKYLFVAYTSMSLSHVRLGFVYLSHFVHLVVGLTPYLS